jgi:hypothetical protein
VPEFQHEIYSLASLGLGSAIQVGNDSHAGPRCRASARTSNVLTPAPPLRLSDRVRLYANYDGNFRAARQSHQGTLWHRVEVVALRRRPAQLGLPAT